MSKPPIISEQEATKTLLELRSQLPAIEAQMTAAAVDSLAILEAKQAALADLQAKRQEAAQELQKLLAQPPTTKVTVATKRQARIAALGEVIAAHDEPIKAAQAAVAEAQRAVHLARGKVGNDFRRQIGVIEAGVMQWRHDRIIALEQELKRLKDPALLNIQSELKRLTVTANAMGRGEYPVISASPAPRPAPATTPPPAAVQVQQPVQPATTPSAQPKRAGKDGLLDFLRDLGVTVDPASGKLTVPVVGIG